MKTISHGYGAYSRGICRCDTCKAAKSKRMRETRMAHDGLPPGDPRHGTQNAYDHWRCRCEMCNSAKARTRGARH